MAGVKIVLPSLTALLTALALQACTTPAPQVPPAPAPPALVPPPEARVADDVRPPLHYRCDDRTDFSVRFANDTAVLDRGVLGNDTLLRDAGGLTPQQSVYSNARLRAEFGLGPGNREAVLHYLSPAKDVRCAGD